MHDQKLKPSMYLQALTGAAAPGDAIVDTQGFKAAVVYVVSGTIADSTWTFEVEVGNDPALAGSTIATVANGLLIDTNILLNGAPSDQAPGTVASIVDVPLVFAATDDDTVRRAGVVCPYRYLRVNLVGGAVPEPEEGGLKGGVTPAIFGAFVELLEADVRPVYQD